MAETRKKKKKEEDKLLNVEQKDLPEKVGELLKFYREHKKKKLKDVSEFLRIKLKYLEAIEEENYQDLPCAAYAIGFVRSYAVYLGLDGEDITKRFKEQISEISKRSDFFVLEPDTEASSPSTGAIFIAFLVALMVYFGWSLYSEKNSKKVELVADTPEHLFTEDDTGGTQDSITPENLGMSDKVEESTISNNPVEENAEANPNPETNTPAEKITTTVTATEEAATPNQGGEHNSAEQNTTNVPVEPVSNDSETKTPETKKDLAVEAAVEKNPQIPEKTVEKSNQEAVTKPVEPAKPNQPVEPTKPTQEEAYQPKVYGIENTNSRITIKANTTSWLHVTGINREGKDSIFLSRVLNAGDSYMVPNLGKLKLSTGNAGGLEVMVDGVKVKPLGDSGSIKRNISLDIDYLKGDRTEVQPVPVLDMVEKPVDIVVPEKEVTPSQPVIRTIRTLTTPAN